MKNFSRIVRQAFQFRVTLAASVVCAIAVALLWGGNIGAIYPFVEVVIQGDSLQDWIVKSIDESEGAIAEKTALAQQYREDLQRAAPELHAELLAKIAQAESRVAAEQKAIAGYRQAKPYIDNYLPSDPFMTLVLVIGLLLLGTLAKNFFLIANTILVARLAHRSTFELRNHFYRRTLRLDLATFNEEGTADLMSRFTHDTAQVSAGIEALFGRMIREPLKMLVCLIGAAVICWRLLLVSLLVAPIAAFLVRWLAKTLKQANRRAMEEMAEIYATLEETFRGIRIVKAFTNEPQQRREFRERSHQYYKKAMRIARYDSLSRPTTETMGIISISVAILAGAWLVLSNETQLLGITMSERPLDVGTLLLFYGLLAGSADPIRKLTDIFTRLQRAAAASDRVYSRLDREPTIHDPENPVRLRRRECDLVLDHVDFAYRQQQTILKDVNLRIPFGKTVAIVGPNGCGKSTLANLIPRFYDPSAGTLRLDGVSLGDLRVEDVRRRIGLVTQETFLFDDTISSNIRYGSPDATDEEVVRAARRAHAHRFIEEELPDGYETIVGSGGSRLSGGQRQRIALARAILRDPAIMILDEATSQIDLESEREIEQALSEFLRNRTAVIITHRMSILALADQVVVMQAGRILDKGTHTELLTRCELYQRLNKIQFKDPDDTDSSVAA